MLSIDLTRPFDTVRVAAKPPFRRRTAGFEILDGQGDRIKDLPHAPITAETPWRLVKKYCQAAGIDPDRLGGQGWVVEKSDHGW